MNVVLYAVVPRLVMPPAMVLTIVVAFLIALCISAAAVIVMHYLTIVHDTARQAKHQRC